MEPPAALTLSVLDFRAAALESDGESGALLADPRSESSAVVQINDQIDLAPRICRCFTAYLDSDAPRRAEFRKAVAYVAGQFQFESFQIPSLEEDTAAALSIARCAADFVHAIDAGDAIDGVISGSVVVDLLADACATIALAYRYVVGFYETDPMLSKLGEVAVRLILLAEAESDSTREANKVDPQRPAMSQDAVKADQEVASTMSSFAPPAAPQNEVVSLEVVSQRLKEQIVLLA